MCGLVLRLLDGFKGVLAQPFAANSAVVTLNIGVLLGLARLGLIQSHVAFFGPFHQLSTDIFGSIINTYRGGFSAPLNDLVQAAYIVSISLCAWGLTEQVLSSTLTALFSLQLLEDHAEPYQMHPPLFR